MATNKKLSATITIGGGVTSSLTSAIGGTTSKLKALGTEIGALTKRQKLLGESLQVFRKAGMDVDTLRGKYAQTTAELGKMRREFERLQTAQANARRIGGIVSAGALGVGAGVVAAGAVSRPLVGAAIARENVLTAIRNSGVSKEDADAMIGAAATSKQFGVSVTKATDTVMELRTALGDAHHAIEALPTTLKAISGLALYDRLHHTDLAAGDSSYQLAKIAEERGGANDPAALKAKQDWAFRAITGSGGKISAADLLTSVRSGKGAVQAMSDEAFFGDSFLQQSMGADRYGTSSSSLVNAWIGGHQTHGAFQHMMEMGLLNKAGVKFDKNGNVNKVSPDALVDAQTFLKDPQKWVDTHLAPLAKSRGVDMNDPAQIMAFVGAIASNPNAANMLLSRMRFSANIAKDRRNVTQANGIDASDAANRASTQGRIDNARARINDAEARMGAVLLPTLAGALERFAGALEGLNRLADSSPMLFKTLTWGLVGLTAAVAGLTAVGITSKLATEGLTVATGAYSAAMSLSTTRIGAATASLGKFALAAGVMIGLANGADAILGKFGVGGKTIDQAQDDRNWNAATAWEKYNPLGSGMARVIEKTGSAIGLTNLANQAQAERIKNETEYLKKQGRLPDVPPMAGKGGGTVTDNSQTTIQVYQQPGEDQRALAERIKREMDKRSAIDSRSSLLDGVGAQ